MSVGSYRYYFRGFPGACSFLISAGAIRLRVRTVATEVVTSEVLLEVEAKCE